MLKFKGYPREYTDAKIRRAEAEFRSGKTKSEVCKIIDVKAETFEDWMRTPHGRAAQ
jgi:transposase-like protein